MSACIIPIPLDKESAPPDAQPTLVRDQATPAFGRISHALTESFELSITVEDDDLANADPDLIYARLFRTPSGGGGLVQVGDIKLAPSTDPIRASGTFGALQWCQIFSGSTDLRVIVSDRPWSGPPAPPTDSPGKTDSDWWILECH